MFGNGLSLLRRASGEQFPYPLRERPDVFDVELPTTFRRTLPSQPSSLGVGQVLLFGPRQRLCVDQHTLSLIAFSGPTKADYDRAKRRVAACSSGESGIATRKENKMIQIGARQAERPFVLQTKKPPLSKLLATFRAH